MHHGGKDGGGRIVIIKTNHHSSGLSLDNLIRTLNKHSGRSGHGENTPVERRRDTDREEIGYDRFHSKL